MSDRWAEDAEAARKTVAQRRARLLAYLQQAGLSSRRASAVLGDYEHCLAEHQRAYAHTLECDHGAVYDGEQLFELPDLIDPGATAPGS